MVFRNNVNLKVPVFIRRCLYTEDFPYMYVGEISYWRSDITDNGITEYGSYQLGVMFHHLMAIRNSYHIFTPTCHILLLHQEGTST